MFFACFCSVCLLERFGVVFVCFVFVSFFLGGGGLFLLLSVVLKTLFPAILVSV